MVSTEVFSLQESPPWVCVMPAAEAHVILVVGPCGRWGLALSLAIGYPDLCCVAAASWTWNV